MSVTKFEKPMGTEITTLSEQIGTIAQNVTLSSAVFSGDLQLRKTLGNVLFNLSCNKPVSAGGLTANTYYTIGTAPEGFRPQRDASFLCTLNDDKADLVDMMLKFTIKTNGDLILRTPSTIPSWYVTLYVQAVSAFYAG